VVLASIEASPSPAELELRAAVAARDAELRTLSGRLAALVAAQGAAEEETRLLRLQLEAALAAQRPPASSSPHCAARKGGHRQTESLATFATQDSMQSSESEDMLGCDTLASEEGQGQGQGQGQDGVRIGRRGCQRHSITSPMVVTVTEYMRLRSNEVRVGVCCGGVVWCVVVVWWCGVVWCGMVWWCGVVWCGVVWYGVVWCGVVWCASYGLWPRSGRCLIAV
jgi:hypothetical protein